VTSTERIAATAELLEIRCREHGLLLTLDKRISEKSLAHLLGQDDEYLARQRLEGSSPAYYRLPAADPRTRISYGLTDVAEWLVGLRECPSCRRDALDR